MTDLAWSLKAAADLFELHFLSTSPDRPATSPVRAVRGTETGRGKASP